MVVVAPNITDSPDSQIVLENERAVLTCVAEGRPPPIITWFQGYSAVEQNNVIISIVTVRRGARQSVSNLTIVSSVPRDADEYTCNATNIAGIDTQTAILTIHGMSSTKQCVCYTNVLFIIAVLPEILFLEPSPLITVNQSNSATFQCNATGFPLPIIQWYMNSEELSLPGSGDDMLMSDDLNSRINIIESVYSDYLTPGGYVPSLLSVLTISSTVSDDSGTYTCIASNVVGSSMIPEEDEENTTLFVQGQ